MAMLAPAAVDARAQCAVHLLSNHGLVMLCVAAQPGAREREIAGRVGIAERSAGRIVADLVALGYVDRRRLGRGYVYGINADAPLHHPLWAERTVRDFLRLLRREEEPPG
ncbi:MAG TPA: AsnC family transcriptional regulator [Candidatus Dormibacteraeota bacterium]|jgi:DNA-binding IclR family transcriptional regulator|nr:AsnC family transcriptional regulator [Candidatus Dormibacteraeota bacterium]